MTADLLVSGLETNEKEMASLLFTLLCKEDTHSLYFAVSDYGYTFTDVNRR